MTLAAAIGWGLVALAGAAIGYTLMATAAVARFARAPLPAATMPEPATLLKPLHGGEPRLAENLATFLQQDWASSIEMIAGVADPRDPALAALDTLPQGPWRCVTPVVDATRHGANAKVGNLLNMMPAASHDLLVLSDSDMAVRPDYLARVAAALAQPGVGAVTALYYGRGAAGPWSRFAAAAIGWQFLPGVAMSAMLGVGDACMGSTIALRRETLAAAGGFAGLANTLADDHALGAAVRRLGLRVVLTPRMALAHDCTETSLAAVWRHELRWAATVRAVNPAGHAGSLLTHPLPLALAAVPFLPLSGVVAVAAAIAARLVLIGRVEHLTGERAAPRWWLPARDLLSFAVFAWSFVARGFDWRGQALKMEGHGRVSTAPESR